MRYPEPSPDRRPRPGFLRSHTGTFFAHHFFLIERFGAEPRPIRYLGLHQIRPQGGDSGEKGRWPEVPPTPLFAFSSSHESHMDQHLELFAALAAPFGHEEVRVRQQAGRQLHYITARTVMNRLDDAVGPANWWDEYMPLENSVICRLTHPIAGWHHADQVGRRGLRRHAGFG